MLSAATERVRSVCLREGFEFLIQVRRPGSEFLNHRRAELRCRLRAALPKMVAVVACSVPIAREKAH
jgi:hypothetical protein